MSLPIGFSTSCLSGAPAVPLEPFYDKATNLTMCAPSFFCPELDPFNASTFPVYCAPLPDCAVKRLFGAPCDPQSPFEPQVCPIGHYCPALNPRTATRQDRMPKPCPEGHFCPQGSVTPTPCAPLSWCDPYTVNPFYYGSFVGLLSGVVLLVLAVVIYLKFIRVSGRKSSLAQPTSPTSDVLALTSDAAANVMQGKREIALAALCEAFERARCGRKPLNFAFEDLKVTLPASLGGKQLLQGVTGHVKPGRVTAILGPSGAGKTVLFTTLLGKLEDAWAVEGSLAINGERERSGYKSAIGFVPQDDVLHGELTVGGNLYYSSELRLPTHWSGAERLALRDAVLSLLDLEEERDVGVGKAGVDGLNGGKRKAISIGVELVAAPMALFLDEPTTGLDAATSLRLCSVLKDVAVRANVSVAMVIHQPRAEIFNALDEILILAPGGYTVYQGPQSASVEYFESQGVRFDPQYNPADVIMDAVAERGRELTEAWLVFINSSGGSPVFKKNKSHKVIPEALALPSAPATEAQHPLAPAFSPEGTPAAFVAPSGGTNAVAYVDHSASEQVSEDHAPDTAPHKQHDASNLYQAPAPSDAVDFSTPNFFKQCLLFHQRRVEKQLASWGDIIVELVVIGACGLVIGQSMRGFFLLATYKAPYKVISPQPFASIMAQLHMYMMMSLGLAASVAGVNVFGQERANYFRDAQSGSNRMAYFIGTVTASFYRVIFFGLVFATCVHGLGRLQIPFAVMFGVLAVEYLAVYAIAVCVSIVASQRDSPLIASSLSILSAVFNGFIPFPNGLRYLSPSFWGSQIMHQYHDDTILPYGETTLGPWGYERGRVDLSFVVIVLWTLAYLCIAAILLFVTNRSRQR